jgi:hypothetical protein
MGRQKLISFRLENLVNIAWIHVKNLLSFSMERKKSTSVNESTHKKGHRPLILY